MYGDRPSFRVRVCVLLRRLKCLTIRTDVGEVADFVPTDTDEPAVDEFGRKSIVMDPPHSGHPTVSSGVGSVGAGSDRFILSEVLRVRARPGSLNCCVIRPRSGDSLGEAGQQIRPRR